MDIPGVAAKDKHACLVHHGRVVVPRGRGYAIGDGASPGLLLVTGNSWVSCSCHYIPCDNKSKGKKFEI